MHRRQRLSGTRTLRTGGSAHTETQTPPTTRTTSWHKTRLVRRCTQRAPGTRARGSPGHVQWQGRRRLAGDCALAPPGPRPENAHSRCGRCPFLRRHLVSCCTAGRRRWHRRADAPLPERSPGIAAPHSGPSLCCWRQFHVRPGPPGPGSEERNDFWIQCAILKNKNSALSAPFRGRIAGHGSD